MKTLPITKHFLDLKDAALALASEQPEVNNQAIFAAMTSHLFHDGMYVRTGTYPKGMVIVGKLHKKQAVVQILKGSMAVCSNNGMEEVLTAGRVFVNPPNNMNVWVVLEDSIITGTFRTDATTVEDAEADVLHPNQDLLKGVTVCSYQQ